MREQKILPSSNKFSGFEERLCNLGGVVWSQRPNCRRTKIVTGAFSKYTKGDVWLFIEQRKL